MRNCNGRLPGAAGTIAGVGALSGLIAGLIVGLHHDDRNGTSTVLGLMGALTGGLGGGLTIQSVILCREWISPFVTPAILWAFVGFLTGVSSYRVSLWMPERHKSASESAGTAGSPDPVVAARQRRQLLVFRIFVFRVLVVLAVLGFVFILLSIPTNRYLN